MSLQQAKSFVAGSIAGTEIRTSRSTDDYQSYTLIQQIYAKPDTYIGSAELMEREALVFDFQNNRLLRTTLDMPEGMERIFLEIISNAGDNADASRRMGIKPGSIDVTCDAKTVTVRNGGAPIPLYPTSNSTIEEPMYVPSDIFGKLLTSSNYDPSIIRMGAGTNGYGSKVASIFSKLMVVTIGDAKNGQLWKGIWRNNMSEHEYQITPGHVWDPTPREGYPEGMWGLKGGPYTGPDFVEVQYELDFKRFGYEEYPPIAHCIFARATIEFGFTCKLPVSFNEVQYNVQNIQDYAALCWNEEQVKSSIVHYEWAGKKEPLSLSSLTKAKKKAKMADPDSIDQIPIGEILCVDTNVSDTLSYVNGLMTANHGVHVTAAFANVANMFLPKINKLYEGKEGDVKVKLTVKDVKANMAMVVNFRLPNSKYRSQSKNYLASPKPYVKIPDKALEPLKNWGLINRLIATAESRIMKTLKKGKHKKGRFIRDKGSDANWAGHKTKAHLCTLYIVEGESASSYPKKRIDLMPGGKDTGGYYPLKGKFMNISKKSPLDIANNKEIQDLTQMMGLTEGYTYRTEQERSTLRYGVFMITTDMDSDGTHIRMLLVNFINKYPGLIENGLVRYLRTYAVRLFKGLSEKAACMGRFATNEEYEDWEGKNPGHGFEVKYYKGLGTSSDEDIVDDLTTAPVIIFGYDERALLNIDMAFGKKNSDARKAWIKAQRDVVRSDEITFDPNNPLIGWRGISNTINTDLVDYTIDSLFRSIPSYLDCLKKVQRQTLEYFLYKWGYGSKPKRSAKIGVIGADCGQRCHYHHGPVAMLDTVVRMIWPFVGSNNLPYYKGVGQLGTRDAGGADAAAPRYAEALPLDWLYQVIHKEMVELVPRRIVEKEEGEPEWIPMDIPIGIVNGFNGMATGHSTFLPSHNLYEVIAHVYALCTGGTPLPLKPYFKGFKGSVNFIERGAKKHTLSKVAPPEEEEDNSDMQVPIVPEEDGEKAVAILKSIPAELIDEPFGVEVPPLATKNGLRSVETLGIYEVTKVHPDKSVNITITELPVGFWMKNYVKWLGKLQTEGRIAEYRDKCTTNTVLYYITKFKPIKGVNHRALRLRSSFGLSNITLIDNSGYPRVYPSTDAVILDYFHNMYGMYSKYRQSMIDKMKAKIVDNEWKIYFISLVIEEKIKVLKQSKKFVYEQMDQYKIPHLYYKKVTLPNCSIEEIEKLQKEIEKLKGEGVEIEKLTPEGLWATNLIKKKYDLEYLKMVGWA
jgi:DNA topoisomerase-2